MTRILGVLTHFLQEAHDGHEQSDRLLQQLRDRLVRLDASSHVRLLQQLLCMREPNPPLPDGVLADVELVLRAWRSRRLLTVAASIPPALSFARDDGPAGSVSVWTGDMTALAGVTAVANAADSRGLGCFQPGHRCIDRAVHAWAGLRLRADCHALMARRGRNLEPGECFVTGGRCLPAAHVVHVLGPQLAPGAAPEARDRESLTRCYLSVLEAAEPLPPEADGRKRVVFCAISAGLFAFPARQAAAIAVDTVAAWLHEHPRTTVTDVTFNTSTSADRVVYEDVLSSPPRAWRPWLAPSPPAPPVIKCDSLDRARQWLSSADAVVVSAGAGLSASIGLDYTSTALFAKEFPGFLRYGLRTLYSVFGFSGWTYEQDRWGYYFTHLGLVRSWPRSGVYRALISWLDGFGPDAHVRTSNADGLFAAHGWSPDRLSTPQDSYAVLQCLDNCRPEATEPSEPRLLAAQPSLHPATQRLMDPSKVPWCRHCGGAVSVCVRGGAWFNERPFRDGEECWRKFRERLRRDCANVVVLELGVGVSTPGVLRWPDELLVRTGGGGVRLVRVGAGPESAVRGDLEGKGLALSINGDITAAVRGLLAPGGSRDHAVGQR